MVRDNATRRAARRAYVEDGRSLEVIAAALDVNPRTVWRWKMEAAEAGDDWMEARRTVQREVPPMSSAFGRDFRAIERAVAAAIEATGRDRSLTPDAAIDRIAELLAGFYKLHKGAAGTERQSLRDAVLRFNAEGLAGLVDRPCGHRPERLSEGEQAALAAHVLRGPDPERGEPSTWTLPDLCRFIEARFNKTMCPQSMSRVVRRLGLSRQKARPVHPQRSAKAADAFAKGGSLQP